MPELWSEIERRAEAPTTRGAVARIGGRRTVLRGAPLDTPLARQPGLSLSWMVALAALLVTIIAAGGLVAGAWRLQDLRPPVLPAVSPSPSPSLPIPPSPTLLVPGPAAATPECPGADSSVALTDQRWTAGPPGPQSEVQPGAIAAFAFDRPEAPLAVGLIDPENGEMCRLVDLNSRDAASAPAWSPDGTALAFVVDQNVLVWSEFGLVRPSSGHDVYEVAWSPDGSALVALGGRPDEFGYPTNVELVFADGSPARDVAFDCDPCSVGAPIWSPDGSHIVFVYYPDPSTSEFAGQFYELPAIVSVAEGLGTVLDLGKTRIRPERWLDDNTFLAWRIEETGTGERWQLLSLPIDDPRAYTVVGEPLEAYRMDLSPDGRLATHVTVVLPPVVLPTDDAEAIELAMVDLATGSRRVIVQANDLAGFVPSFLPVWAPDSRTLALPANLYPEVNAITLWRVNADGSGLRQLIAERSPELRMESSGWQPVWP